MTIRVAKLGLNFQPIALSKVLLFKSFRINFVSLGNLKCLYLERLTILAVTGDVKGNFEPKCFAVLPFVQVLVAGKCQGRILVEVLLVNLSIYIRILVIISLVMKYSPGLPMAKLVNKKLYNLGFVFKLRFKECRPLLYPLSILFVVLLHYR